MAGAGTRYQHGLAQLVASCDRGITRLTRVAHRAPARLLPLRGALANIAGSAVCVLGSYGGGLLGGDTVDLDVKAEPGATLVLGTQASTKVFRTKSAHDFTPSSQKLDATIHPGALLCYVPDPLVPFADSAYEGIQKYDLHKGGSVVAVDWVGSGRAICGERWAFRSYSSRTEARLVDEEGRREAPALVEAVSLQPGCHVRRAASFDVGGVSRDAAVSVVVGGPRAACVAERLVAAAAVLAQRRTGKGVKDAREGIPSVLHDTTAVENGQQNHELLDGLLGDLLLGVSEVPLPQKPHPPTKDGDDPPPPPEVLTVARLVAEYNEDVYRVLNYCMAPLKPELGAVPYSDRMHAKRAAIPPELLDKAHLVGGRHGAYRNDRWRRPPVGEVAIPYSSSEEAAAAAATPAASSAPPQDQVSASQLRRLLHLCDATLPTGGFAHSGGLEAALQLGLLGDRNDKRMNASLRELGTAAVLSAAQQQAPFALAAHGLFAAAIESGEGASTLADSLRDLNAAQHALLVANAPACRASMQLGGAMARIAQTWMDGGHSKTHALAAKALKPRGVHSSVALGALAALLELPSSTVADAFVYTSARDILSAAVRLNLIGPLAAVALQDEIVSDCAAAEWQLSSCDKAAGAAPLLEAAHACHDLLERRVFNS